MGDEETVQINNQRGRMTRTQDEERKGGGGGQSRGQQRKQKSSESERKQQIIYIWRMIASKKRRVRAIEKGEKQNL